MVRFLTQGSKRQSVLFPVGADRCCLPENASKRKKYSSTASGPPPLMQRRSFKTEEQKEQKNKCTPPYGNSLPASPYSLFKKRESLKDKRTQTKGAGAPLRQTTDTHNVGADRCVCPNTQARGRNTPPPQAVPRALPLL